MTRAERIEAAARALLANIDADSDLDGTAFWDMTGNLRAALAVVPVEEERCPSCRGKGEPERPRGYEAICIDCGGTGKAP